MRKPLLFSLLNIKLPYGLAISRYLQKRNEDTCSYKNSYTKVDHSIIHNNKIMETTQMSVNWGMNKQNAFYPGNGILYSHKEGMKY